MREKIKKLLKYAMLDADQFEKVKPLVTAENAFYIKLAAAVQALYFGASLIGSLGLAELADKRLVYGIGTFIPLIVLMLQLTLVPKDGRLQPWLMTLLCAGLFGTGLLCTLVCTPDEMTILLLIFFFCVPMLFIAPPAGQIALVALTDIVYFAAAPVLKAPEVLTMDMLDIGIFSTLSVILGVSQTRGRYRRYWLETEAVDLAKIRYRAAFIDQLTGAFNRNAYNKDVEELSKAPLPADIMIIAADLNGLKNANDSMGHVAGDEIIKGTADCMIRCFDQCGKVYRTGGDEFMVIARKGDIPAGTLLDRLNRTVAEWHGSLVKSFTISYGTVTGDETAHLTMHEAELLADKRMYQSKSDYYKNAGIDRRKS